MTGGFLGLIAYLSIFAWCAWYLLIRPMIDKADESFTVMERGVLLGILAGYFTHNIVVFDNIVSYIFFAIILGLITSRVGEVPKRLQDLKIDTALIKQIAAPVVTACLVVSIYLFHSPGMQASGSLIDAFREQDPTVRLEHFNQALAADSFAHQEITEQLSQQTISIVRDSSIPGEIKQAYASATESELQKLASNKPGDARIHVFIGSYYRAINELEKAKEQMALARQFSPNKQAIIIQQGFIELSLGNNEAGRDFFQTAFELDENNLEAREYYAAALFYAGDVDAAIGLMNDEAARARFAASDFLIGAANNAEAVGFVQELLEERVATEPSTRQNWKFDPQTWASLAFVYYQQDDNDKAIDTLNEASELIPSFAGIASCFIENIEAGNDPQEGCQ